MMSVSTKQSEDAGILVFPGGMEGSLRFARRNLAAKRRIVGASSLAYDPACGQYPAWVRLPQVTKSTEPPPWARAPRRPAAGSGSGAPGAAADRLDRRARPDRRILAEERMGIDWKSSPPPSP